MSPAAGSNSKLKMREPAFKTTLSKYTQVTPGKNQVAKILLSLTSGHLCQMHPSLLTLNLAWPVSWH